MAAMMRKRLSTVVGGAVVVVVVVFAALTSCSSDSSDGSPAQGRPDRSGTGSAAPASDPPPIPAETAASSPTASGPCVGGTCEIKIAVGDVVTVPKTYGLGPIEVTAITGGAVEMVAPVTGLGYSISGCSGGGGVSSRGGGGVRLRCDRGTVATVNDAMSLEVVEIVDNTAVLRIRPRP